MGFAMKEVWVDGKHVCTIYENQHTDCYFIAEEFIGRVEVKA